MSGEPIRVALVDDHPLFRQGLEALIRTAPDLEVVGEAGNLDEARELAGRVPIDVALVDVWIPSGGSNIARELHELQPSCRILGLSVAEDPCIIAEMLRAGAIGFALKSDPPARILEAVHLTASGIQYLPERISHEQIELELAATGPVDTHLSKREQEIFELVIRGYTNSEIGARLFIARRTVETHRYRITKKLRAHSLVEMQRLAARHRT